MRDNDLRPSTHAAYERLAPEAQQEFEANVEHYRKDVRVAYLWWFCFGSHRAYLGHWNLQLLFWLTAGGLLVWWIWDAFRMERLVILYNRDISARIMTGFQSHR